MSRHARLAPSAAHRWMNCPGSVDLSADIPSEPNEYAAEGTVAHSIAASALEAHMAGGSWRESLYAQVGATFVEDGFTIEFTEEMADAVAVYVAFCVDELVLNTVRESAFSACIELSLHGIMSDQIDKDTGGTPDFFCYQHMTKTLSLTDLKFGQGVMVEAEDNKQLKLYAAGALLALDQVGTRVEKVRLTIVQPRHEGTQPIKTWEFDAWEILEFINDAQKAAELTRPSENMAPLYKMGDWCNWCPAKLKCPLMGDTVTAIVKAGFALPDNPERLAQALDTVPLMKQWIKAVESLGYKMATAGSKVPGHKLVKKRPTRQWKNEADVLQFAEDHDLTSKDIFTEPTLKSPAQVEKKLSKEDKEELAELIEKVSGGTVLVPESDKRPEYKAIEDDDFATIEGESTNLDDLL